MSILPPLTWSDGIAPRFTIGRVGIDVPVGTPAKWDQNGDRVSVAGQLVANSYVGANVLRQQLAAYAARDGEDVVPVTWEADPTVDGYYRVLGAAIASRPSSLFAHLWDFTVELERVTSGWRRPGFESIVAAAWTDNAAARAAEHAKPWIAVPGTVTDLTRDATTVLYCADDPAGMLLVDIPDVVPPLWARWAVAPADYYIGSARVTVAGQTIVGTQVGDVDPYGFVLDNGVTQVKIVGPGGIAGIAGHGNLAIRHRVAAGWSAWKGYLVDQYLRFLTDPPVLAEATTMRILRNTPEEVIVRVVAVTDLGDPTNPSTRQTYDLGLRRGSTYVTVVAKSSPAPPWQVTRAVLEAAETTTEYGTEGVIVADVADADGVRYVIASPMDWATPDLVNGGVGWTTGGFATLTFAIGAVVPTIATSATEDAVRLADRYLTAQGETVQPIAW